MPRRFLLFILLILALFPSSRAILARAAGPGASRDVHITSALTDRLRLTASARGPILLDAELYPPVLGPNWRPPMPLSLAPIPAPRGAARPIDAAALEAVLRGILDSPGVDRADYALVVEDLTGDFRFSLAPDRRFASASLVKVPIAFAVYEEIAAGRIPRRAGFPYLTRHRVGGSGTLKDETPGVVVPLRDLLYLSLAESDNTATNILADAVGARRINEAARRHMGRVTDYRRKVLDLDARRRGIENMTTAAEMANAFRRLHRGEVVSAIASSELLRLMADTAIDDRIQRYLPERIPVAHKTGLLRNVAHDCGLVYLPGARVFLISALSRVERGDYRTRKFVIARVARAVYEASVSPEAWEPPRRTD